MTFAAKYRGHCPKCQTGIEAGDDVRYQDGQLVHDECVEAPDPTQLRPGEVVCTDCWLVKPCECEES